MHALLCEEWGDGKSEHTKKTVVELQQCVKEMRDEIPGASRPSPGRTRMQISLT